MTTPIRALLVAACFVAATACAPAQDAEAPMVHVGHNSIQPTEVTIAAGGSVVFHNMDEMPGGHTIEAVDGSFESPPLAKDQQWTHTFAEPGRYPIRIRQHPKATGTVIVQ